MALYRASIECLTTFPQKLNRRLAVVRDPAFSALRVHESAYGALGVDGMSSEEDCPEPSSSSGLPKRVIYRKAYLSKEVSKLNAHVDSIYEKHWGPRPYLLSSPIVKTCARWIPGLPINFYDEVLLAQLESSQRRRLRIGLKVHPLTYYAGPI